MAKLEAGVAHIERDVGKLRTDMRNVRDRLAKLETKVDHLPGKGFTVATVVLTLGVFSAVIVFQGQIQSIVARAQPAAAQPMTTP